MGGSRNRGEYVQGREYIERLLLARTEYKEKSDKDEEEQEERHEERMSPNSPSSNGRCSGSQA